MAASAGQTVTLAAVADVAAVASFRPFSVISNNFGKVVIITIATADNVVIVTTSGQHETKQGNDK
jgi:hypothetical protein